MGHTADGQSSDRAPGGGGGEEDPLLNTPRSTGNGPRMSWAVTGGADGETARAAVFSTRTAVTMLTARPEDVEVQKKDLCLFVYYFALLLLTGSSTQVLFIIQEAPMKNYPMFLFFYPTLVFLVICGLYLIPVISLSEDKSQYKSKLSQMWPCIMGLLDTIAGLLLVLATLFLSSGSVNVLLQQSAVPISMLLSLIFLKTKYLFFNYVGALIVLLAVVYVLVVPSGSTGLTGFYLDGYDILWGGILILSQFPSALSGIMREHVIRRDPNYDLVMMNFVITVYQLIWGTVLAIPLVYLWGYGLGSDLNSTKPIVDLPQGMVDGFSCYMGQNVREGDNCAKAPIYVNSYIIANSLFNVFYLLAVKHGSATLAYLAMTAIVPLNDLIFAIPGIPKYQRFDVKDVVGLVVIVVGLTVYRFFDPLYRCLCAGRGKRKANSPAIGPDIDVVHVKS